MFSLLITQLPRGLSFSEAALAVGRILGDAQAAHLTCLADRLIASRKPRHLGQVFDPITQESLLVNLLRPGQAAEIDCFSGERNGLEVESVFGNLNQHEALFQIKAFHALSVFAEIVSHEFS
jgi:hypothetical protein